MSKVKDDILTGGKKSIYQELKEFCDKKLGVPYSYQDFGVTGIREFKVIFEKIKPLEICEKIKLANKLIKILLNYNNTKDVLSDLRGHITLNPIIDYYEVFLKIFKAIIEEYPEYIVDLSNMVNILLHQGNSSEEIKLALMMSCVIKPDEIESILETLSISNEYIFYVIKVYESMKNANNKIFNLAKKSKGYGKALCIQALQPISYEIKEWLIEEGMEDNLGDIECLSYTILPLDILSYLKTKKFNNENIKATSKSFSILFSEYTIDDIDDGLKVCFEFLNLVDKYGKDIYSLYGVISMIYSIEALIVEESNLENTNKLSYLETEYSKIISLSEKIYKKDIWQDIILTELGNIEIDTEIIISSVEKTSFKLKKSEFELIIRRDFTNPALYRYAFEYGSRAIKKVVFKTVLEKLSIVDILKGQDDIKIEDLDIEDLEHVCFYFLIKGMKYEDFPDEYKETNLSALKAKLVETRIQAIKNLNKIKDKFDLTDTKVIESAIKTEKVASVKVSLTSLLSKSNAKKKEYVDVKDIEVIPHVKDIYIMSTEVAGTQYVDMSEVDDLLAEGEILYLNREYNNPYDENAIQIVFETGYILGYIPRTNNLILKNLMDKGKYFYGIIEKISDDYEYIVIMIYLSYKDVINEITTTLSLLTGKEDNYIQ
ncbi:HIRAN domain-containing protein [Clostridium uliginosum]|uniref:HIRAN domain-containing protein n=1 Tax=Clostridium uliginosum TaxID=119641 RepID=A0A1I1K3B1_9CLOT|nr:HIRAN domain-containing protein [Clostridium uliginosum]SFC55439.1 HIRAN domain-containing protein [Clostridium uliginosum]